MPNYYLKDLFICISLNPSIIHDPDKVEKVVLPIFQKIYIWRNKRMLKTSLGINLTFDIDFYESGQEAAVASILPPVHHAAGNGADILWLNFEKPFPNYLEALHAYQFAHALQLFYDYYEQISMLYLGLTCHYSHVETPIGLKVPSWSVPHDLPPVQQCIYAPLALLIEAKLLCLPTLMSRPNCLFFHTGAGALAKAMSGAPLIAPSLMDPMSGGNLARAFADSLSLHLDLHTSPQTLFQFRALKQTVDYFNTLHESGYISNQETRNVLMKSIREPSPLMYMLYYPKICEIAQTLFNRDPGFNALVPILIQSIDQLNSAEKTGTLTLKSEELSVLLHCRDQLSAHL